jgi:hypothetical protein
LLAQLCDWWEWVGGPGRGRPFNIPPAVHWRMPYGVWNPLLEGGATDLDECLDTGSRVGLVRTDDLFPELT